MKVLCFSTARSSLPFLFPTSVIWRVADLIDTKGKYIMAKNAKAVPQGAQNKIVLGRNFLDVKQFNKFLRQSRDLFDNKTYKSLKSCYERCMQGTPKIEVKVEVITDTGLANCTFYCRGAIGESLYAPADCLTAIKPAPMKINHPRNEFSRLSHQYAS